jgi:hypothetical protein
MPVQSVKVAAPAAAAELYQPQVMDMAPLLVVQVVVAAVLVATAVEHQIQITAEVVVAEVVDGVLVAAILLLIHMVELVALPVVKQLN